MNRRCIILEIIIYLIYCPIIHSLRLINLNVPSHVDIRKPVTFVCTFDLGNQKLYSVKWYKDDFEFFSFKPDNTPPTQDFPVPGINLDLSRSNSTAVTLRLLTFNSSGAYRCEVSTEAPNFETVFRTSKMDVVAWPLHDPLVVNIQPRYSIGDEIIGNCTTAKSYPSPQVSWFVNGVKADRWWLDDELHDVDRDGLHTKTLGLRFMAERRHFPSGTLLLKCVSQVANRTWDRVVESYLEGMDSGRVSQERLRNSGTSVSSLSGLLIIFFLLLRCKMIT